MAVIVGPLPCIQSGIYVPPGKPFQTHISSEEEKNCYTKLGFEVSLDDSDLKDNNSNSGSSGGGGANTAKELNAQAIRTSVESGQAITPPEGYDGFSEITFPSYLLIEEEIVVNGTKEFGTDSAPYFPKKVTVNIPSDYTIEEKSFNKSSEPFTLDCSDKSFVYLMTVASNSVGQGIAGLVSDLKNDFTVNVSSAGSTAGTMTWTASTKTLTYTPNTNFQMGSTRFKLVAI